MQTGNSRTIMVRGAEAQSRKAGSTTTPDVGLSPGVSGDMERGNSRWRSITRPVPGDQPKGKIFQIFKNLVNCCGISRCVILDDYLDE
jgi:hypothetical protein